MTEVVAALIRREDRFLICQRPGSKARGMLWELAGGKVEPGETRQEALVRECREELGITLAVKEVFSETTYSYPELTIHLTVFNAEIAEGSVQKLEHNDLCWIRAEEREAYPLCPADRIILRKLDEE